jgi:hypothetical protein
MSDNAVYKVVGTAPAVTHQSAQLSSDMVGTHNFQILLADFYLERGIAPAAPVHRLRPICYAPLLIWAA